MATKPNELKDETIKAELIPKNKHNYKLSEEEVNNILIDYYIDKSNTNVMNICNKHNISKQWLYQLVKKNKNSLDKRVEKVINRNRQNFTKKSEALINKALTRLNKELEDESKDININQLSTMLGILYDKTALEQGKATSNNAFNINIKIDKD